MISDRQYPQRPVVGVGAVIVLTREEAARAGWRDPTADLGLVLVKRRFDPLAGRWSLPGGGVETGEPLADAIAREVEEETGLAVDVGPIVDVFDRILLDADGRVQYHFVLIDYLCRPRGGRLAAGSDVAEVALADPGALEPFDLTDKARDVIRKALQHAV
ncbi:MAG TPA: NUDIX domain-containing protein [Vicinamibacterales bacterium]|jgi:ADP-ribose pyrophosphatase YjhB (NUDIX family)